MVKGLGFLMKSFTIRLVILICLILLAIQLIFFYSSSIDVVYIVGRIGNSGIADGHGKFIPRDRSKTFGDMGRPVILPASLQAESKRTFSINEFNLVASDLIGLRRNLDDFRHPSCPRQIPLDKLIPFKTSVIIVFHNEAWSALLRTVHSVLDRTPEQLLHEIILVDDASTQSHLGHQLDNYISSLNKPIRLERMSNRSGLIRARLHGANISTGKTLTFLDAHCEVTIGWLETLLKHIAENPKRIVCPIIDVINHDTFEYLLGSDRTWGTFDWHFTFHWESVVDREIDRIHDNHNVPLRSPTMAGGLFTIIREYFYEIGAYDEGMEIWGGENIELSFRVWQCGGELLIDPCSRVGHVFRKSSPYTWPGGVSNILFKNFVRTALVWLDEYSRFYFLMNPSALSIDYGDVSKRRKLRQQLQCKSFRWYLENIYPESSIPIDVIRLGAVRHKKTDRCLDSLGHKLGEVVGTTHCHGQGGNQVFAITESGSLRVYTGCVDGGNKRTLGTGTLILSKCDSDSISQKFEFIENKIIHKATKLCLTIIQMGKQIRLTLRVCSDTENFYWTLPPLFNDTTSLL
ncbi:Polypeptide N-acetylgalactosaminyltransferase 13 [Schistosoma japonicum]|uniref:Polypeptide N-acetylgalactosaminyltransferase n=1 Tax=Schistosoma japonicum TaxID=6182 RepID=A0A4Z2DQL8_SCHJA|nr:Polypeptide N-acetylgalactosaminyltransferase 13 [Schistosoma japonicum]